MTGTSASKHGHCRCRLHAPAGRARGEGAEAKPMAAAESAARFEAQCRAMGDACVRLHGAGDAESWLGKAATPLLSNETWSAARSLQGLPEGRACHVPAGKRRAGSGNLAGHAKQRAVEAWTVDGAERSVYSGHGKRPWQGDSAGGEEGTADAVGGGSVGEVGRQQLLAVRRRRDAVPSFVGLLRLVQREKQWRLHSPTHGC